jgi:hypothetical protein
MRTPKPTESTERLIDQHVYLEARLNADAETKDLAPPLVAARTGLEAADAAHQAAREAMLAQLALRDGADSAADDALRAAYQALQVSENRAGGKAGPRTKRVFGKGLRGATDGPADAQPGVMAIIAGLLASDPDPTVNAHETAVTQAADALEVANEAYAAAIGAVQIAYGQELAARSEWIRQYEKVYGELIARVGKRKAEGYFPKSRRGS